VPLGELARQVLVVEEAALLEEGALHPADEILHRALLLRAVRPAQLDAQAQVQRHTGEGGIPLGDHAVLAPRERDGLGPVEDGDERQAAPGREVVHHGPHQ
jgi:hypothetical protein